MEEFLVAVGSQFPSLLEEGEDTRLPFADRYMRECEKVAWDTLVGFDVGLASPRITMDELKRQLHEAKEKGDQWVDSGQMYTIPLCAATMYYSWRN